MAIRRLIIIGDVHGCAEELSSLLRHLSPKVGRDEVVFVGDLINRGPDPVGTIKLARAVGAKSVLGNHERRLLKFRQKRDPDILKDHDGPTAKALRATDWKWLASWPLTLHYPKYNLVVAHGGFAPWEPWKKQTADVVTKIQMVNASGKIGKRGQVRAGRPWADLWEGPETVVYGHTPRRFVHKRKFALGIDTGCVYGGKLTAYVLPEKKLYQVQAKRAYAA